MPIIALLNRVRDGGRHPHPFVKRESNVCRSYLTGLAMQAFADGHLDQEEENLFMELARALGLSQQDAQDILLEGRNANEETVYRIRDALIESRYKYYFILDLQIMAHQDNQLHPSEKVVLERFRELLHIDASDTAFLVELADAVVEKDTETRERWAQNFFDDNRPCELGADDFAHYIQQ